jgi:hypothetical protein
VIFLSRNTNTILLPDEALFMKKHDYGTVDQLLDTLIDYTTGRLDGSDGIDTNDVVTVSSK